MSSCISPDDCHDAAGFCVAVLTHNSYVFLRMRSLAEDVTLWRGTSCRLPALIMQNSD